MVQFPARLTDGFGARYRKPGAGDTLNRAISFRKHGIARSLVHASLGLSFAVALLMFPKVPVVAASTALTVCFLLVEFASFVMPGLRRWLSRQFALFLRPQEDKIVTGATYFLIGMTATIVLFPTDIAALAILFLALGDPIAAAIGRWKGRTKLWAKNVEGNLTCLTVCLVLAAIMDVLSHKPGFIVGAVGAFAATLSQALPWRVNDNLTIPIGAAVAMLLAGAIFGP